MLAGFRAGEAYPAESAVLEPGDVLVFYTDGVTEARKRKTQFETERLKKVIEANAGAGAQEIAAAIYAAVADYTGGNLHDDIVLLVLKAE
jgi:serine phosphatase RsbU (regulator of sigma subunit)